MHAASLINSSLSQQTNKQNIKLTISCVQCFSSSFFGTFFYIFFCQILVDFCWPSSNGNGSPLPHHNVDQGCKKKVCEYLFGSPLVHVITIVITVILIVKSEISLELLYPFLKELNSGYSFSGEPGVVFREGEDIHNSGHGRSCCIWSNDW